MFNDLMDKFVNNDVIDKYELLLIWLKWKFVENFIGFYNKLCPMCVKIITSTREGCAVMEGMDFMLHTELLQTNSSNRSKLRSLIGPFSRSLSFPYTQHHTGIYVYALCVYIYDDC